MSANGKQWCDAHLLWRLSKCPNSRWDFFLCLIRTINFRVSMQGDQLKQRLKDRVISNNANFQEHSNDGRRGKITLLNGVKQRYTNSLNRLESGSLMETTKRFIYKATQDFLDFLNFRLTPEASSPSSSSSPPSSSSSSSSFLFFTFPLIFRFCSSDSSCRSS